MSGFVRNDWKSYLNGGTSQYNFSYNSEAPPTSLEQDPVPMPPAPMPAPAPNASESRKNNKNSKVVIPTQKGGKRKSRRGRSQKKYRRTHRK